MLASFFKKSKPINFLIVGVFMTICFIWVNFFTSYSALSWQYIIKTIGCLTAYILVMVLLNFIVKRNQISKKNTYTILLFGLFTTIMIPVLKANEIFIAAFFIMLALRRLVSLSSGIEIKKKLFDASLWVAVASIFYPLSILFMLLVYMGVYYYATQDFKNFFIPLISLIAAYILTTTAYLLLLGMPFSFQHYFISANFNFAAYQKMNVWMPLIIMVLLALVSIFFFLKEIENTVRKRKTTLFMILLFFLISIIISILSPQKTGGEFLFPILGLSIIGTTFFEQKNYKWINETVLAILLLIVLLNPLFA